MPRNLSWKLTAALVLGALVVPTLAVPEASAQVRRPVLRRTIVVNPVPGDAVASGVRLLRTYRFVSAPSATNPWLVKIEPGIYDLGGDQLVMLPFVDVEGSGQDVTVLTGFPAAQGVVVGAADCELRDLTVEHRGGVATATALYNAGDRFSARHVTARASDGTANTTGLSNLGNGVHMEGVTGIADAVQSPNGIVNNGLDARWTDVHAVATGDNFVYAFFNYGDGLFVDIAAEATGDGFAGAIRNEGARAPVYHGVQARAEATGIGQGITNGGGSDAVIRDAFVFASGGDFAVGVSNQFGDTRLYGVETTAEGGSSAFGVANLLGGTHRLTDVTAKGDSPGFGVGLLTDNASTSLVHRSTLEGTDLSVEQRTDPMSTTRIGASQLIGPATAGSGVLVCTGTYDGSFAPLTAACGP